MTKTFSATSARKNFFQLLREASLPGSYIRITLTDEQPVILMSEEEWESWTETMDILSHPEEAKQIKKAISEYEENGIEDTEEWNIDA